MLDRQVIWDHAIPVEIRERCLRSMFHLFERLFAHDPLDTAGQMWWDSLAYDWHCHNRSRENGGEVVGLKMRMSVRHAATGVLTSATPGSTK